MNKFKVNQVPQGGFEVRYGDTYLYLANSPNAVEAAVAGMQAVMAKTPGTLPVDLVKSMDDCQLQRGVIQRWSSLVKSGAAGSAPTAPPPNRGYQPPAAPLQAQLQPNGRANGPISVRREDAMAYLQYRIEELHKAQVSKDYSTLSKTASGALGGALGPLEGPGAINGMIKSLNTTFIRLHMIPAELAAAAPGAMAQGQAVPTAQEYFEQHPMYPSLAKDVQKWLDAGGGQG